MEENDCKDINECLQNPCHPTAKCSNTQGSFTCTCEHGRVGNPFSQPGCMAPDQCHSDEDCHDELSCINKKCTNLCQSPKSQCGPNAKCGVAKHALECTCPSGYLGDPYDTTLGCFKVECTTSEDCSKDKFCDIQSYKCMSMSFVNNAIHFFLRTITFFFILIEYYILDPCDKTNCGQGSCVAENHKGVCSCFDGFALIDNKCVDEDECINRPCHSTAM